ncbi:hypothetical protein C8R47DRAFT_1145035, partial [Mycena vitilis]
MRILPLFQHEGVEFSALQNRRRERIIGGFFSPRDPCTRAVEADLSKNYGRNSGTRLNGAKRKNTNGQPVVINTGVHPVRRDGSHPGYWLAQVGHHIRDVVTHKELAAEASQLVPALHLRGLGTKDEGFCLCRRVPLEDLHGGGQDIHLVNEFARQIAHRRIGGVPRDELAEYVVVPAWAARPEHTNGSISRPDDLQEIPAHHDVNKANLMGDIGEGD